MSRIVNSTASAVASARLAALSRMSCQAGTGRGAGREAAICQAVVELLNETSYESVTMDAVAARAKASKATIYRRWSNKDELVVEALRGMVIGRDLELIDTGNLRDDIVTHISWQLQDPVLVAVNTAALKVLVYAASSDPDLAWSMRLVIRDPQLTAWQTILTRAHERGELHREVDAALMFEVIQGQFCARAGVDAEPVDVGFVEHLADNVLMPVILHAGSRLPSPSSKPRAASGSMATRGD
ncbi:AcrR family transcriptional regulator [Nakamurella sp. UYEF19]|uniref:TetR/AcrR family transcriptional regulator n=1 Tax=Nakamurella sp. UYEF19 TaxID=1756392 RepID=UPI00339123B7